MESLSLGDPDGPGRDTPEETGLGGTDGVRRAEEEDGTSPALLTVGPTLGVPTRPGSTHVYVTPTKRHGPPLVPDFTRTTKIPHIYHDPPPLYKPNPHESPTPCPVDLSLITSRSPRLGVHLPSDLSTVPQPLSTVVGPRGPVPPTPDRGFRGQGAQGTQTRLSL